MWGALNRLFAVLVALQGVSWLFDLDELVHGWVKSHVPLTIFLCILFVLLNWFVFDARRTVRDRDHRSRSAALRRERRNGRP